MLTLRTMLLALIAVAVPVAVGQQPMNEKKELAELARIERLQKSAKAAFDKKPKDVKFRKNYISLSLLLANNTQASMALGSKEKYPKALRLYREVLKTDPTNKEAKTNRDLIESIYRSMGRPIPK